MRLLELFSGTGSVGEVAKSMQWEVVSLDIRPCTHADITRDILTWPFEKEYPVGYFDVIWASFPCATFSYMRRCNLNRPMKKNGQPWTHEAFDREMMEEGVPLLEKSQEIIRHFRPRYFFMENPFFGYAKKFVRDMPFHIVDYCQYAEWGYRKRTIIWTNVEDFQGKTCCRQTCKNMSPGRRSHRLRTDSGGGGVKKNRKQGTTRNEKFRIPSRLVQELFSKCINSVSI